MRKSALLWLVLGALGFAVLPWYMVEGADFSSLRWLAGYPVGPAGSGLFSACSAASRGFCRSRSR